MAARRLDEVNKGFGPTELSGPKLRVVEEDGGGLLAFERCVFTMVCAWVRYG